MAPACPGTGEKAIFRGTVGLVGRRQHVARLLYAGRCSRIRRGSPRARVDGEELGSVSS